MSDRLARFIDDLLAHYTPAPADSVTTAMSHAIGATGPIVGYIWLNIAGQGTTTGTCDGSGWFGPPPGAACDICGQPATVRQGDLVLCAGCYEGIEGP